MGSQPSAGTASSCPGVTLATGTQQRAGCRGPTPHMGSHPRDTCACSLLRALKLGSARPRWKSPRALPHVAVCSGSGSQQGAHTQAPPARTRGRSQQHIDSGFTDTEVTSTVTGPHTTAKADPARRDREESSHHFWPGYIWVPAPQPRPGWDGRPDELCELLSSSLMQARRLAADPAPRGRWDIWHRHQGALRGAAWQRQVCRQEGESPGRAQWAQSWHAGLMGEGLMGPGVGVGLREEHSREMDPWLCGQVGGPGWGGRSQPCSNSGRN